VSQSAQEAVPVQQFPFLADRPVVVQRQPGEMTSDAGLLPLAEFDRRWRLTERIAGCLVDARSDPEHSLLEMLRQRLFGILADYEDCNDHDALRLDPVFKLVAGRSVDDDPLASQPTLSRFENSVRARQLAALFDLLVATGVERLSGHHSGTLPERVVLDLDATDDPTHGAQQLTLFHGYYGQYQYFPLVISEPTTKHVFLARLRHGTAHSALGADEDLRLVVEALRRRRQDVMVHARGDSGFGVPWMYAVCEELGVSYTFGLAGNPRLQSLAEPLLAEAQAKYACTGQKQRLFATWSYQAHSWERERTVIAKAECHSQGTNLRFVVTSERVTSAAEAEGCYDAYIERGESEQRMDELKNGLSAGRLSCHRLLANVFRLLLHSFAYNLLAAVRDSEATPVELRRAQPAKWRSRLIKVAAVVMQSTRRVTVSLSGCWPHWDLLTAVTQRVLAMPLVPVAALPP
jgi:hypothetical protein